MKEKSIIMCSDMVRATLEGRKTQTRRVIKPQPDKYTYEAVPSTLAHMGDLWDWHRKDKYPCNPIAFKCPYGKAGDRLWVRESCCTCQLNGNYVCYKSRKDSKWEGCRFLKWKSPLFMPRWASRITLEIMDVTVERLQEIMPKDVIKEGFEVNSPLTDIGFNYVFGQYWNSFAKPEYKWEKNPFVWVISFKNNTRP